MNSIGIAGLGLMGGSLGLTARKFHPGLQVLGYDQSPRALKEASRLGAITKPCASIAEAANGVDVLFVAAPVGEIAKTALAAFPHLTADAFVTDLGSTKASIVAAMPEGAAFLGGHPIAGSQHSGVKWARDDLYENCLWVLTPIDDAGRERAVLLTVWLGTLGIATFSMTPDHHDEELARVSHLPQVVSSALASVVSAGGQPIAGGRALTEMTRIAASSPDVWLSILKENGAAVMQYLRSLHYEIEHLINLIGLSDWSGLGEYLERAQKAGEMIAAKTGFDTGQMVTVVVSVPDRPAAIAEVLTIVGQASVNVEDIRVEHAAKPGRGELQLDLKRGSGEDKAVQALRAAGVFARIQ